MISLANGAQAPSVFFVADDSAAIGEGSSFEGNLMARNSITVGDDATVEGKAFSLKGDVALGTNAVLGPQVPGFIEICKALDEQLGGGLRERIFRFRIGALITEVPAGQCSGPISIEAGPIVIEELLTGRTTTGANFDGNFQLTDVRQLTNLGQPNTTALVSANLPLRTANVNVVAGDISAQTRLQFTNRFAIIGIVEICKEALDTGVTGFFNFTIDGLRQGNTTVESSSGNLTVPAPLVPFTVPVGQCTGPIAVTVASGVNNGTPRVGQATVNELPRTGFIFTSATTALGTAGTPTQRLISFNVLANGGGNATVVVVEGGTTSQTTVFMNNRTAPGQLKICKVAGPGIPELTPFTFTVIGAAPNAPLEGPTAVPVSGNTQNPSLGVAQTGAVLQGGTLVRRDVTVLAGPISNPGGFCQIVDGTFIVDTPAFITETGPATVTILTGANFVGQVRVSRITSSTGIVSNSTAATVNPVFFPTTTFTTNPGVAFFPGTTVAGSTTNTGTTNSVVVPIRRGVTEVEFVNIAFIPVPLKICKVAGSASLLNQPFTFTVSADTAGGLLAPFTSTVTVLAGPAAVNPGDQNGFCDFVSGPFSNPNTNNLGSFNFNSTVTVTEGATAGVAVTGITSPTGGVIGNLTNRTGLITNMVNGVNEVQFVNTVATAPTVKRKRARLFNSEL
jgi:hypothetical protein